MRLAIASIGVSMGIACQCAPHPGLGTDSGTPPADAGISRRDAGNIVSDGGCPDPVLTDVVTYHNDMARTGQYLTETCLKPSNVKTATFGKLFTLSVDGKVDAEPLYLWGVPFTGQGTHDAIFVATEHGTLYAFDADAKANPLWKTSLLGTGETPSDDRGCNQVSPEIGITATPVIDPNALVIYAVAMSKDANGKYHQRLHALDVTTGKELANSPAEVQATFPGTAVPNDGGHQVVFDPAQYKERPGMLLMNGIVYTAWSSHCDFTPYTGWVMAYDAMTLRQTAVVNVIPNGSEGSFWMAGSGIAADGAGNLYLLSGNGTFDTTLDANGFPNQGDFGNAFVKISTANGGLKVTDYFTMFNTVSESGGDVDLGSGGVMLLPDSVGSAAHPHLAIGAGKDAHLYLVDQDNLGKFNPNDNSQIVQDLTGVLGGQCFSIPAYFSGAIFYGAVGDNLKRIPIASGQMAMPSSASVASFQYPGTFPSISADGADSANGIVWAVEAATGLTNAVLHAYLASDLSQELYNSNQAAGGADHFGAGNKYIVPMIANSRIYVATPNGVGVFGLK